MAGRGFLPVVSALLFVSLAASPTATALFARAPPQPLPGHNGMDTDFGEIQMPYRPPTNGSKADLVAEVVLRGDAGVADAPMYLFAFGAPSRSVNLRLETITRADGTPVRIDRDERTVDGSQSNVLVRAADLPPPGTPILLRGAGAAENTGRYQVGALVIAFDADWDHAETRDGEMAQLYAYGFLTGPPGGSSDPMRPPFEGRGNVSPWPFALLGLAIAGAAGWLAFAAFRRNQIGVSS